MTRSRSLRQSWISGVYLCCALGAVLGLQTAVGWAADRCVLAEEFTATWCLHCPEAAAALTQLEGEYPGAVIGLQIHVSDSPYSIPWATSRFLSYPNHPGMPDVWFDGVLQKLGATTVEATYAAYLAHFNTRQAVPTDVTIEIGGVEVEGPTYTLQARVCLEAGGVPKTVRVYIARALDHYPAFPSWSRNCLMEVAETADIELVPGQCEIIERTLTFDEASWLQQNDIRVFAWAQVPGDSGPREVFQSALAAWPLEPLLPDLLVGDMNCDSTVGFGDINPFVLYLSNLSAWQSTYPGCNPENGDINGDGTYGYGAFGDINPFVALLTSPPQTGP